MYSCVAISSNKCSYKQRGRYKTVKIRKGSAEPSVSPTFAVNRTLNKNEDKSK